MGLGKPSSAETPAGLTLPDRLYGREARLARLRAVYERVAAGGPPVLACVTGDSGVGKSALLEEFRRQVPAPGLVLAATFVPEERDVPYSAVAAALGGLGTWPSTVPAQRLADWPARLVAAVGSGADVLIDLVPALRPVFGAQAPVADLPVRQSRARMHLAVRRLVAEVAGQVRPLVLLLDDLHHADEASLDLIGELISDPPIEHLLVLGAFRPPPAGSAASLAATIRGLGRSVTTLPLRPLSDAALAELLADTLRTTRTGVAPLARLVAAKTGSNPLSVHHFLRRLADGEVLRRARTGAWTWDLEAVRQVGAGSHARELIGYRLQEQPPRVRQLLATAATIGTRFAAATLQAVAGGPVAAPLDLAVRAGFLAAAGDGELRFSHDQVRQAALDLVVDDDLDPLRLRIGRALPEDSTFAVVGQLNAARTLITADPERIRLAELNLRAGNTAQRWGAPEAARGYFAAGLSALPADPWERCPDLAVALHMRAAEAEHVAGYPDRALRLLDKAMVRTNVDLSRVEVLALHANLPRLGGDWDADAEPGIRALRLLGIDLPTTTDGWRAAADAALGTLRHRLAGVRLSDLTGRPPMTDRPALAATNLIATLLPAARVRPPDWLTLLAARAATLALDHGATVSSSIPFAFAGLVLADQREHEAATLCMDMALHLVGGVPATQYAAQAKAVVALSLPPWRRSVQFAVGLLREAYADALERGDQQFAKANWMLYQMHLFATGTHLDAVAEETRAVWEFLAQQGEDPIVAMSNRAMDDILAGLRGRGTGLAPPESPREAQLARACRGGALGHASSVILTRMLAAAVLLGDYPRALELAETIEAVEPYGRGRFTAADRSFYHALTLTQCFESVPPEQRRAWSAKLDELQAALDDWAGAAPAAFGYRALLVSAERTRLAGNVDQAVGQYSRAIAAAREHGFPHGEGMAAELGGRYAAARGIPDAAVAYLRRARTCYEQWGAGTKVEELDRLIAGLSAQEPAQAPEPLDLLTTLHAIETISAHLRLDELLPTLLTLLVQQAGAERGALLLPGPDGRLRQAAPAEPVPLPDGPVGYVRDTGRTVAGDYLDVGKLAPDPYLDRHAPASLLCTPIRYAGELMAVVYLEHRQVAELFGELARHQLQALFTHAGIALHNAGTYELLAATVRELPVPVLVLDLDRKVRAASPGAIGRLGDQIPDDPGTPLYDARQRLIGHLIVVP